MLFKRTQATHLMEIKTSATFISDLYSGKVKKIELWIYYYAIDEDQITIQLAGRDRFLMNASQISPREFNTSKVSRWLSRITPNSITISPTVSHFYPSFESRENKNIEVQELHNHGIIPPFISGTQFTRVEHPDGYQIFDYEFSLFPSTHLLFINQDIKVKTNYDPNTTSQTPEYYSLKLKYTAACTHASGQASLFSPLGTTYAAIGIGLCLFHNESEGRFSTNYIDSSGLFQLGHRIFLSKNYFLGIDAEVISFGNRIYESKVLKLSSTTKGNFVLGYYVADAEGVFARTWKRLFSEN
jgi:hypothetical protein